MYARYELMTTLDYAHSYDMHLIIYYASQQKNKPVQEQGCRFTFVAGVQRNVKQYAEAI